MVTPMVKTYQYDSFGNIVAETGDLENPFAYTGREWEPELGLYYYRARWYDPTVGRFLSEDPIGFLAGPNLFAYVGNNSVNRVDPFGFQSIEIFAYSGGGSSGGVPSSGGGWGHTWVDLYDEAGNRIGYGFYPSEPAGIESILGGSYGSAFNDDTASGHLFSGSGQWDITPEQYQRARNFMESYNREWSLYNNCTDFAMETAQEAGISLNDYSWFGVSDPNTLAEELDRSNK